MERLRRYKDNRALFEDEHAKVYKAQFDRIDRVIGNFGRVVSYVTVLNYQRLMTTKIADLIFGEPPSVTVSNDHLQAEIDKLIIRTDLWLHAYMVAIDVSRYGDGLLQLSKLGDAQVIDVTPPALWYPVVDPANMHRIRYHVFGSIYLLDPAKTTYGLSVHIHDPQAPGRCEAHQYRLSGQPGSYKIAADITAASARLLETQLDACPVYRVTNLLTSDRIYGMDDYQSVDSIISELIVRISQVSKVLDQFASPSMTGPQSALEYDDLTQQWRLRVGNYYPRNSADEPAPEYLVWDASMDANFAQIEVLINQLYAVSEMGSAIFGGLDNKTGDVPSGSALRRLMMSPLAKARRVANNFAGPLKHLIADCVRLRGYDLQPEDITITWHDGLPEDPKEAAEIMDIRTAGKATISQYTAIQRLDNTTAADTDAELAMIHSDALDNTLGLPPEVPPTERDQVGVG